jgi:glycosyltransferase involved in cell wall biosynthesis
MNSYGTSPVISVVMSVHNGEKYLREAVESILNQAFRDFEFIIIDDGSTDCSKEMLEQYAAKDPRIRLISREHRGRPKSLNEGIALAKGELIAIMDADDISLPERLVKQSAHLKKHRSCVAVGGYALRIDCDGDPINLWEVPVSHEAVDSHHIAGDVAGMIHPAVTIRLKALTDIGGYDERLSVTQDLDLWLRLAEVGELANLPEVVLKYRVHFASVTMQKRLLQTNAAKQVISEARRRRKLPPGRLQDWSQWVHMPTWKIKEEWVISALKAGNYRTARKHALAIAVAKPFRRERWRLLARTLLAGRPRLSQAIKLVLLR